ncbi:hypothetical protein [Intestinimonas butyriciproducens]|uniref:hypothetical protein n=1 Tax=Intestinimonas butyriciproducens TaxID=1297617 RepID=UPI00195AAC99|nr:hypothetical protein [Intestinimonas butyriciproducens]MBM6918148.1 hypothetical protein [Intestinimonas butyriciproducens]
MKKRILLGLLVALSWGACTYLGYLKESSYQVYAVPLTLLQIFMGVCLGLLLWGRMEDLSPQNLRFDAFSALRLVVTVALLVAVHLVYEYLGRYGAPVEYWVMMGLVAGASLPGILLRGAYGKGHYRKR